MPIKSTVKFIVELIICYVSEKANDEIVQLLVSVLETLLLKLIHAKFGFSNAYALIFKPELEYTRHTGRVFFTNNLIGKSYYLNSIYIVMLLGIPLPVSPTSLLGYSKV